MIAEPLLVTLFQNDNFTDTDVMRAAGSLRAYSIGLLAFMAVKIFAPGYYARQDTATPVRIGIQAMLLNMLLNVVFVVSMLQTEFVAPHVGLALATSASAYFNAFRLARELRRDAILGPPAEFSLPLLKILGACIAMGLLIQFMLPDVELWSEVRWHQRLLELAWLILPAVLCYGGMLWIMGFRRQHIIA